MLLRLCGKGSELGVDALWRKPARESWMFRWTMTMMTVKTKTESKTKQVYPKVETRINTLFLVESLNSLYHLLGDAIWRRLWPKPAEFLF
jgi:hypothetical protein